MSCFEWTQNLSHVRFGRMERRFGAASTGCILHAAESVTDRFLDEGVRDEGVRAAVAVAASEEDPVNAGLEETMVPGRRAPGETARA